MTDKNYGIARIDDLESFSIPNQQGLTWRPVRRHFGISSFGVNAYTATEAGQRLVEEHREKDGHDELYVVLSGRATFKLEGEEHDALAGTLIHCPPGTLREAFAAEPGTTVLGIGAQPGVVFEPSGWEWVFAGFSRLA
jgi:Cupin domain